MADTEKDYVWYFGYGSNMNSEQLTAGKGVVPLESEAATLPGWQLAFNMVTILKSMGSMANVVPKPDSVVHGTLHKFTLEQLKLVDEFEGEGRFYKRVSAPVITYSGKQLQAFVYTALPECVTAFDTPPSLRYKTILVNGARASNVAADYISFLEAIEITSFIHNKNRPPPVIPDKTFTREEVKEDRDKVAFMGIVFEITGLPPNLRTVFKQFGTGMPAEWAFVRLMPTTPGVPKQAVPENFADFTPEQLLFLDSGLHAMEEEWPILGRCLLPTSISLP